MNYLPLEEKGLSIPGLGLAGAASGSAALSAVGQPFPRAFGMVFIRRPATTLLKIRRKIQDGSWGGFVGWTMLISKIVAKQFKHFPAVFNIPPLSQSGVCFYSWLHPCWPTGETRTSFGVLGLICVSFPNSSENTTSPSLPNIKRHWDWFQKIEIFYSSS